MIKKYNILVQDDSTNAITILFYTLIELNRIKFFIYIIVLRYNNNYNGITMTAKRKQMRDESAMY